MKKTIFATLFALATVSLFAKETVHYDSTTYGPSNTVVHYDNDRHEEKSAIRANMPNDEIYSKQSKKK
ncbi:hypothetical protein [Hydrogenimonas sp. SS33]|uniref:hypothetical protein n=1 Tax=Hydrogenimonas leucolamina TaxID=2954236 RepID=UPI00336BC77B